MLGGGTVYTDRIGKAHQDCAHFFCRVEVERKFLPGGRVTLEIGDAAVTGLGFDRQEAQRRARPGVVI
jgi:hypothetical protein